MEVVDRKTPNLSIKKSGKRMTREEFLHDIEQVNGSGAAKATKKAHLNRLDHYCNKMHGMSADETLEWLYEKTKSDQEDREIMAIDFLKQAVSFCKVSHPDILLYPGYLNKTIPNPNNHLKKLNDNTIPVWIASVVVYMRVVFNIKLQYQDYVKSIGMPVIVRRGIYDDEDAEPLTTTQARNVLDTLTHHKTKVICRVMNDLGFRISEIYNIVEDDFNLTADPPSCKVPNYAVKGIKTRGVRYLQDSTVEAVKTLLIDKDEYHPFRRVETQKLETFETGVRTKLRTAYNKQKLIAKYSDSDRYRYNVHSWRKRCCTEYGRINGEAQADGYIRHAGNLKQYHMRSLEEREQQFRVACVDLALDGLAKKDAELKISAIENSELKQTQAALIEIQKEKEEWEKQQEKATRMQVIEMFKEQEELKKKK